MQEATTHSIEQEEKSLQADQRYFGNNANVYSVSKNVLEERACLFVP